MSLSISKEHIKIVLLIIIGVLLFLNITGIFRHTDESDKDKLALIKAKDEVIKEKEVLIEHLKEDNQKADNERQSHERKDSILAIQSKQVTTKYVQIPVIIHSFTDDSLQIAVERFH